MKKEIEVWVSEKHVLEGRNHPDVHLTNPQHFTQKYIKGFLVVDVPEPEITITPSRLRDAIQAMPIIFDAGHIEYVVEELFGEVKE